MSVASDLQLANPRESVRRPAAWAANWTEWIVLIVLLVASLPPVLFRRQSLTVIPWLNILDGSLILDTCYKAAHGIWFGRDVAMTRGPLFQWLSSAPSRWISQSLGSTYATSHTLLFLCVVVAAFLSARLLLPTAPAWRRALFLLLAVVFWSDSDPRTVLPVLAFAVFVRFTDSLFAVEAVQPLPDDKKGSVGIGPLAWRAVAASVMCIVAFLFSADTGIYTAAALLLCCVAAVVVHGRALRVMKFLLLVAVSSSVGVILVNAWFMGSPRNFFLWRSSLVLVSEYRWSVPLPIDRTGTLVLLGTLLLGVVVFGAAWWSHNKGSAIVRRANDGSGIDPGPWTQRPVFLLAGFALAVFILQSGMVRSDPSHLRTGICPMVIFCGAIAFDEFGPGRLTRLAAPALAVVLTVIFAHAEVQFVPGYVFDQMRQIAKPVIACPDGWAEFDQACIPQAQADIFGMLSRYVDRNVSPDRSIAVFPYETIVGLLSRRNVASGVMQSYLVNGDYLTGLEVEALQQKRPLFGVYFPDGIMGNAVDNVPSFTRSTSLWFYLVGHYRGEASPLPGATGLITDDTRAGRIVTVAAEIAAPVGTVPIAKRSTSLDLGAVHWPASSGADFLKLRLRVDYPWWWRVRKPSELTLRISFGDGSEKSIAFVMPPNRTCDLWFYPWDDRTMIGYFSSDAALWRLGNRPSIAGLTLGVRPFDWISALPSSISIERIEAVRLGMQ